jgi:long-chain fatty acid transport protein
MNRLAFALTALMSSTAIAGGMVLPVHGVRDLERAGAYIAGSEDADSLFLNPAGLAHLAGTTAILIDGAYVNQLVDYTRIDSGGNKLPTVSNQYPGIVVPTIAVAHGIGDKLVLAAGVTAPYAGIGRYSFTGPQRYASVSLAETLLIQLAVGAAYAITPRLRVGVTVQDMVSRLYSQVVLSACPGQTVCAPEDPEFDANTQIKQNDYWAPSASAGVQWDVIPQITIGAMFQLHTKIRGTGTLETKLPSSDLFDGSSVQGNSASLAFDLPAMAKFGVEAHPMKNLRVEAALDIELWSVQENFTITPHDVTIVNAAGIGEYQVGESVIPRHYNNSYAPSIGGEYRIGKATIGAGYSYETAAAPPEYVSVLTVDSSKHLVGLGGSCELWGWTVGGALGFVHLTTVNVPLDEAGVPQLNPIRNEPNDIYVNAGTYKSNYVLGGLRLSRQF